MSIHRLCRSFARPSIRANLLTLEVKRKFTHINKGGLSENTRTSFGDKISAYLIASGVMGGNIGFNAPKDTNIGVKVIAAVCGAVAAPIFMPAVFLGMPVGLLTGLVTCSEASISIDKGNKNLYKKTIVSTS